MRLEFENGTIIEEPDETAIADGLATLGSENLFAILSTDDMTYIQASGDQEKGFVLEYHAGSNEEHYGCIQKSLPLERVVEAFQKFARGDDSYKQDFEWLRQGAGGGCMGAIVLLSLAGAAAGGAAYFLA